MTNQAPPITAPEAAQILGCSSRTIQRMVDTGDLPILRKLPGPNGALLFDPDAVRLAGEARAKASEAVTS